MGTTATWLVLLEAWQMGVPAGVIFVVGGAGALGKHFSFYIFGYFWMIWAHNIHIIISYIYIYIHVYIFYYISIFVYIYIIFMYTYDNDM